MFLVNKPVVSDFMREHLSFHEYSHLLTPEEFESDILAQEDSFFACYDREQEDENGKESTI